MLKTLSRYTKWLPAICLLVITIITVYALCKCQNIYESFDDTFNNNINNNTNNIENNKEKVVDELREIQEEYLIEQIKADPNKTKLDKDIMEDLTRQYFTSSDTLPMLREFNDEARKVNPIPGDQLIRDILRDYGKSS